MASALGYAYRDGALHCDGVPLAAIAAACGTPTFVYSAALLADRFAAFDAALDSVPHRVCYAVKTNSNLAVLGTLARAGAGFDIVSAGELARLEQVGAPAERIVFAGVGKTAAEMDHALRAGIGTFNVESLPEAEQLAGVAGAAGRTARVALRINPDLPAGGHHHVSTGRGAEKFGVPSEDAPDVWQAIAALGPLQVRGVHCHVGSQIVGTETFGEVAAHLAGVVRRLRSAGATVEDVNLGGGLGIRYRDETPPAPAEYARAILPALVPLGVRVLVEPGRALAGESGVLLARVVYRKETRHKTFVVVDAGMNDLVRPSLYGAYHEILPLAPRTDAPAEPVDVVGPLCEAGDFLARDRRLPRLEAGDVLAVCGAGAYGFSMSSNYNSRPRAAEVLVRDGTFRVVRRRESAEDLWRGETDWPVAPSADPVA